MAQLVPSVGSDEAMKKEAIEQIRARVEYQKALIAAQHEHDDVGEMYRWLNISMYVGLPLTGLLLLYSFLFDEHHHRVEGPLPEHMKIRSKEFPWECSDCDLFDGACWKACRAEKK